MAVISDNILNLCSIELINHIFDKLPLYICNIKSNTSLMNTKELSKEHRILITMRKVLSSIIRDTTPPPGRPHPLNAHTIEDIKHCFALITSREKEIHDEAGETMDARPRYADEPKKTSQVVQFTKPSKD